MALETDGFAAAVAAAARRHGPERIAVIMGSSTSGVSEGEIAYRNRDPETGALPAAFDFATTQDFYSLPRFVSAYLNLTGPNTTVSAACASSNKVFADAWQWIRSGVCEAAVVGGVDSLCRLTLRGFNALELTSRDPCRPNDAARSGLSIGEAAGFALLEQVPSPAPGSIALLGYGESSDAYHMSAPHPEGKGAILAMEAALARAALGPGDIDYINLHGTGSRANDQVEDLAVSGIFGATVPTSSTKGWTGHTLGAAGITEAVISGLCLGEGFIPPNLGLQDLDPEFRSAVQRTPLDRPIQRVLSNSFGFGGSNCSIILGRVS
jgi:3-oxoacyl-[acyl-carrier-protein] synthase-1